MLCLDHTLACLNPYTKDSNSRGMEPYLPNKNLNLAVHKRVIAFNVKHRF